MELAQQSIIAYSAFTVEIAGILAILIGAIWATARYFSRLRSPDAYHGFRAHLGRGILIGLEFLVAADIIRTVSIEPTWSQVGILAVIVLIRTFLSMTLSMEINSWLPWERHRNKTCN
jgi:uncharacterized membrane protein